MDSFKRPRDDGGNGKEEIQLDLEAFTPTDSDIFGIQLLLQQLFRNVKGDTRSLAELVVKYNCGASIMKQVDDAEVNQEEDTVASGAAGNSGVNAETEQSSMDYDDASAVLALFAALPRSERTVNELVRALIGRLPKDSPEHHKFASLSNETEPSLVVFLESIANFPPKISAAMCAQFVDTDLSMSASQYAAYRSIHHVLILRRAVIHSNTEAEDQSASADLQRVELCFDEDHVFTEFATAVSGFEYAVATKSKQRADAETVGTKRKQSKRQDSSEDEESDEESTGGIALLLLTFEQFVAAVQKLKATYL